MKWARPMLVWFLECFWHGFFGVDFMWNGMASCFWQGCLDTILCNFKQFLQNFISFFILVIVPAKINGHSDATTRWKMEPIRMEPPRIPMESKEPPSDTSTECTNTRPPQCWKGLGRGRDMNGKWTVLGVVLGVAKHGPMGLRITSVLNPWNVCSSLRESSSSR